MSKKFKLYFYNLLVFFILIIVIELIFGHWFSKDNFGVYMRKERNKNWNINSTFNDKEYSFFYKRNFYGFRGEEFDPKNVKIIFNGGSTAVQMYTPEELTIVGLLNSYFLKDNLDIKIFNSSTNGKSLRGIIYDHENWFSKIEDFNPKFAILYLGINERTLAEDLDENLYDFHKQKKKIDQFKDYYKNNSFVFKLYVDIKNKYFPKNVSGYFLDYKNLYSNNYRYINFSEALNMEREINLEEKKIILQLEKRLNILKDIFINRKITPIIITQVAYDGLNDNKLYLVNQKLKDYASKNNFFLIKLDEIIEMKIGDFYDPVHTTPQGSLRIAETLYPHLKEILNNN